MLKALVIKELRESAGIIVLAALAAVFALASLANLPLLPFSPVGADSFPFVSDGFLMCLGWIIGVMAVALALKQSTWESAHNTYHFLLHRPVSRKFLFGTKLAVGIVATLIVGTLMIVFYAAWAVAPGHTGVPFFWSMTVPSWQLLISLPIVYLGAFLSGIRPARWFGSRLGPAITAGFITWLIAAICPWWWLAAVIVAVLAVIHLAAIALYIEGRDY